MLPVEARPTVHPAALASRRAIVGSLLGTAIGDAIGLPYEGLSRRRGIRLLGEPAGHRLILGRGMVSDDTEHACMVAQALIASRGDAQAYARQLAWRLRGWLLTVPAGIGWATLRAILKLWMGFPPSRSGVFSAGNGPAMRSAVLGASIDDLATLRNMVAVTTRITHSDPKAELGALAVAYAAWFARRSARVEGGQFFEGLRAFCPGSASGELLDVLGSAVQSAARGERTPTYAASLHLERGVTGYVNHTVPVAIHAWLANPGDFRRAIEDVVRCGGDTDTVAAIAGGIIGSAVGKEGIPGDWLDGLLEWPRSLRWMESLGERLAASGDSPIAAPPRLPIPGLLVRNAVFTLVVLAHGLRRALPPY